jgi:MurNAc alpha-1-phosphate uridylyltransferase
MRAMILAAGRGERMRPLTDATPKPLLAAGGKPLIVWHIEALVRAGIRDIVINHAHLGGMIEAALGDGGRFGAPSATRPRARRWRPPAASPALPLLGDAPLRRHQRRHRLRLRLRAAARIGRRHADRHLQAHSGAGAQSAAPSARRLSLHDGNVSDAARPEAHLLRHRPLRSRLFAGIARGAKARLAPLLRAAMAEGAVSGELHAGLWIDVGTPERLAELDRLLSAL